MYRVEVELNIMDRHPNQTFYKRHVFNCATEELMEQTIAEIDKYDTMVVIDSGSALVINDAAEVADCVAKIGKAGAR